MRALLYGKSAAGVVARTEKDSPRHSVQFGPPAGILKDTTSSGPRRGGRDLKVKTASGAGNFVGVHLRISPTFNAFPTPDAARVWILSRNSWYTAGTYRKLSRNGRMRTYVNTLSIHRILSNIPHPIHYPHSRIVVSIHDAHSYSSLTHSNRIPTPRTRGYRRISTAPLTCVTSSFLRPKRGGSDTAWQSLQRNMVTIS